MARSEAAYDQEDEEADRIYAQVDAEMDARRRRRRREAVEGGEADAAASGAGNVAAAAAPFTELKRALSQVTEEEWASLPEPGDLRAVGRKMRRLRQKEYERFTPAPDSLLALATARNQSDSSVGAESVVPGTQSVMGGTQSMMADFRQISKARDDLLKVKLDQLSSSAAVTGSSNGGGAAGGTETPLMGGGTTVDPKGYLTALSSIIVKTDAEVGDIKKVCSLIFHTVFWYSWSM